MMKVKVVMFDTSGYNRTAIIEGFTVEEVTEILEEGIQKGDNVIVDTEGTIFNLRNIVQINPPKYIETGGK